MDHKRVCNKENCSGCGACMGVCPRKAIEWRFVPQGWHYAGIMYDKCIDCGLCGMVCPGQEGEKQEFLQKPQSSYAAKTKDNDTYSRSSSGGISAELAKLFHKTGGVVYGACMFPEEFAVRHIRVDSYEELEKIQKSKYVQSYIDGLLYERILKDLQDGKAVLFTGTPCQIGGGKTIHRCF